MAGVKVTGLKELSKSCKAVSKDLNKELLKVGKDSAELVADTGRTLAPKRTGRLAGQVKPGSTASGAYVAVRGLIYAPVIHFGWARHNISPNPFLYHALDQRRSDVVEKYERQVAELIERNF
jgi:hypothetical protein